MHLVDDVWAPVTAVHSGDDARTLIILTLIVGILSFGIWIGNSKLLTGRNGPMIMLCVIVGLCSFAIFEFLSGDRHVRFSDIGTMGFVIAVLIERLRKSR